MSIAVVAWDGITFEALTDRPLDIPRMFSEGKVINSARVRGAPSVIPVGDEWQEMRAVFYQSMRAIEHALSARREYLTKDRQIVQGGPDHYARLAATKHFRDFLNTGRPAPKQPEPKDKMLTLPELEAMLRASKENRT